MRLQHCHIEETLASPQPKYVVYKLNASGIPKWKPDFVCDEKGNFWKDISCSEVWRTSERNHGKSFDSEVF